MTSWRKMSCVGIVVLVGAMWGPAVASEEGQAAANQVSTNNYQTLMNLHLYTHTGNSRGPSGAHHDLARNNIKTLFESYGLPTYYDTFTYSGGTWENVVAEQTGTLYPSQIFIVGAHYDSVNNPGADDNASGVAAVLETARVLSQYDSAYTIRYIAFDMEEQGLIGSDHYATGHAGDNILGMLSLDMVAYDPNTNHALIYGRAASAPLKNALADAIAEYSGGLTCTVSGQLDQSDHAPFEWQGFQACLLIEGQVWNNPYYHTQNDSYDTAGYLNFAYATKMTRSVVGWLVDAALVDVPVDTLKFAYPDDRPEFVWPIGGTRVRVVVTGKGTMVPQPGTGLLYYAVDGGSYAVVPMESVSANVYDAVFPSVPCGAAVTYYVSAQSTAGDTIYNPADAPASAYAALAGYGWIVAFEDDFETNQGWTVGDTGDNATSGLWARNIPQATAAQPGTDHTPDPGVMCWVTDYRAGSSIGQYDVDDGKTTLKSPILDLSGQPDDVSISYWRWYSNDQGAAPNTDTFRVDISSNGGTTWVNAETVGPSGPGTSGGWYYHELRVTDFVPLTSQVRLRFIAEDLAPGSIVEAALDDFRIQCLDCEAPVLRGDLNCNGSVGFDDINPFVLRLSNPSQYFTAYPDCLDANGDINEDGTVDFADINPFVTLLTQE